MSELPQVVTFGELLLRLSPPGSEPLLQSPGFRVNFGGAEANVAVSLAHLGVPVRYVTALPANPLGGAGLDALQGEGVEVRALEVRNSRLGLFFVDLGTQNRPPATIYDRAHSAFTSLAASSFPWLELLAGAGWFHCTGITPALGDGPAAALKAAVGAARYHRMPVSLDLNYRPALWTGRNPRELMVPLAQDADLLIANQTSLAAMLGLANDDARKVAEVSGAKRVAITRRDVEAGSHEWSAKLYDAASGTLHASKVYRVRAVDRVGAGDCFAAALISRLLQVKEGGCSLEHALEFAVAASAHKLTVPGDWSRLDSEGVERLLQQVDPAWS